MISEEIKHPRLVNLTLIEPDIIFQLNFLSLALTQVTTPIRPIGHNIDVHTAKTTVNPTAIIMKEPESVSVTNTQATTTQADSLNTNLTDNMNLLGSSPVNMSYPFQTTRTINTRNDTQDDLSINNTNSIRSNNNSTGFNLEQNQSHVPATNPLVRFNNVQRYNSNTNNGQNN